MPVGASSIKSIDDMLSIRLMDIRAVDLNLLKAFDALIAERAVTRAASRIGLSQPASLILRKARCTLARVPTLNDTCCTIGVSSSVSRPRTSTTW